MASPPKLKQGDSLSAAELRRVEAIVTAYLAQSEQIETFHNAMLGYLTGSQRLAKFVHSFRSRLKDADHLRHKLRRKLIEARKEGKAFNVTPENLLLTINDLSGIRILHLHMRQFGDIDREIKSIINDQSLSLVEGPIAKTWDIETKKYFSDIGVATEDNSDMYTSVHYVVRSHSRTLVTSEIQVRTLMEEVWGEVSHKLNYPVPTEIIPCREQILTLARLTSATSRLVDAIVVTEGFYQGSTGKVLAAAKPPKGTKPKAAKRK